MKTVEYRLVMPLSLEQYQIAQLYMVAKSSLEDTAGGDGVEIVTNEPFKDGTWDGQFTHKRISIAGHLPKWVLSLANPKWLVFEEKAWNAFPMCKTEYSCPLFPRLTLVVESMHHPGVCTHDNPLDLPEKTLRVRQVDVIDIVNDPIPPDEYREDEDPALFSSQKAGFSPMSKEWMSRADPVMTCYKVIAVDFPLLGFQNKIEDLTQKLLRNALLKYHRKAICWMDEWHGMRLEDIRALEAQVKAKLDRAWAKERTSDEDSDNVEANPTTPEPQEDEDGEVEVVGIEGGLGMGSPSSRRRRSPKAAASPTGTDRGRLGRSPSLRLEEYRRSSSRLSLRRSSSRVGTPKPPLHPATALHTPSSHRALPGGAGAAPPLTATTRRPKCGYLFKLGEGPISYSWHRRYVTVRVGGAAMFYYGDARDSVPRGRVPLRGAEVTWAGEVSGRAHAFAVTVTSSAGWKRTLHFSASTVEATKQWMGWMQRAATAASSLPAYAPSAVTAPPTQVPSPSPFPSSPTSLRRPPNEQHKTQTHRAAPLSHAGASATATAGPPRQDRWASAANIISSSGSGSSGPLSLALPASWARPGLEGTPHMPDTAAAIPGPPPPAAAAAPPPPPAAAAAAVPSRLPVVPLASDEGMMNDLSPSSDMSAPASPPWFPLPSQPPPTHSRDRDPWWWRKSANASVGQLSDGIEEALHEVCKAAKRMDAKGTLVEADQGLRLSVADLHTWRVFGGARRHGRGMAGGPCVRLLGWLCLVVLILPFLSSLCAPDGFLAWVFESMVTSPSWHGALAVLLSVFCLTLFIRYRHPGPRQYSYAERWESSSPRAGAARLPPDARLVQATCMVFSPPLDVFSLLMDLQRTREWLPGHLQSERIETIDAHNDVIYETFRPVLSSAALPGGNHVGLGLRRLCRRRYWWSLADGSYFILLQTSDDAERRLLNATVAAQAARARSRRNTRHGQVAAPSMPPQPQRRTAWLDWLGRGNGGGQPSVAEWVGGWPARGNTAGLSGESTLVGASDDVPIAPLEAAKAIKAEGYELVSFGGWVPDWGEEACLLTRARAIGQLRYLTLVAPGIPPQHEHDHNAINGTIGKQQRVGEVWEEGTAAVCSRSGSAHAGATTTSTDGLCPSPLTAASASGNGSGSRSGEASSASGGTRGSARRSNLHPRNDSSPSRREWPLHGLVRLPEGGLRCIDASQMEKQKGVILDLIKSAGQALLEGKNIVSISLPVRVFEPRSGLERISDQWSFGPTFLRKAAMVPPGPNQALERLKYVISFCVAGLHRACSQLKPFNPILGETFQAAWCDGSHLFMEHTSHHPPISHFQADGPDGLFRFWGFYEFKGQLKGNAAVGRQEGPLVVEFHDGGRVEYTMPAAKLSGLIWGARTFEWVDRLRFEDRANGLTCTLVLAPDGRPLFGLPRTPVDTLRGSIKKDGKSVVSVTGSWLEGLHFDGKSYWSLYDFEPATLTPVGGTDVLPSDCRYREDLIYLAHGDEDQAQRWKLALEVRQRRDRSLRNERKHFP
ncbi:unnamed protein product [Vitrella brassicaformis CCMP3155]|uniref:PH domain-containing protein n=1 Tax=Vitrella brassicaformis (strain CCMP3155) TaxID=1169540 RepID=A0A0G4EMV5_VITBC|nr:unnamed protein product [Vitrella brassicaformis CCMP3155]|eukprot:CEL98315.1 unnamed protein product [Vitrella brassicaformis CCMP3155]